MIPMKIKIFKHVSIQANLNDDFPKVIAYFKKHGVDLILDFESSNIEKGDAVLKLMAPNDGVYDCVMYIYNRGAFQDVSNGLTFKVSPTLVGIYLATSVTDDNVDYSWKSICHELMHFLFFKYIKDGGNVPLDKTMVNGVFIPYYKNEELDAPDGNFAVAWKILTPYISQNAPALTPWTQVVITRQVDDTVETTGLLEASNNGATFSCRTLELPEKNNQPNISCIPKGVYNVAWTYSFKFLKKTYEIQNVKARSGIRIHSANYFYELLGCIALGSNLVDINGDKHLDTTNSRATIKSFEDFMQRKNFTLTIK